MATNPAVAARYSKALQQCAQSPAEMTKLNEELVRLAETISNSQELSDLLGSKVFSSEEKWKALSEILSKADASKTLHGFLRQVVEAGRGDIIADISAEFTDRVYALTGVVRAEVETARDLNQEQLSAVRESLERRSGKKVILTTKNNPALLAGVRAHMSGMTFDSSLQSSLYKLKQQLLSAN